jgi:Flp pilus assembly protein TadD
MAVNLAAEAVRLEPQDEVGLLLVAMASDLDGQTGDARAAYGRAVELVARKGVDLGLLGDICTQGDEIVRRDFVISSSKKARELGNIKQTLASARWLAEASRASGGFGEFAVLAAAAFGDARHPDDARRLVRGMALIPTFANRLAKLRIPPATNEAESRYADAVRRWSSGDYDEAVLGFLQAESLSGGDGFSLEASADALFAQGLFDRAQVLLLTAQQKRRTDATIAVALGRLRLASGDFRGAEKALSSVLATEPNFPGLARDVGFLKLDMGDMKMAKASFERALVEWPHDERAALGLVDANLRLGSIEEARAVATALVSRVGWSADAHEALARVLAYSDATQAEAHRLVASRLRLACIRRPLIQLGLLPAPGRLAGRTKFALGLSPLDDTWPRERSVDALDAGTRRPLSATETVPAVVRPPVQNK